MPRPGRLDGRTCLIVGGTSGIGLASARRFLQEGARVVVTGSEPEIGRTALDQLGPLGPISEFTLDLADGEEAVARMFAFALDEPGADGSMSCCTSPGSAVESLATGRCTSVPTKAGSASCEPTRRGCS